MASTTCIYNVSFANISIQGAGFALTKITWANTPASTQSVLVQYRKQGDIAWINVSTNLQVDVYGNVPDGLVIILTPAELATYYEVRFVNQCGSLEYIQTFFYPGGLNVGTYLLDNGIYNICGNEAVTLFSDIPFAVGAKMYTDPGLTILQTGFNFLAVAGTGVIYALNFATGVVGADTTYECNGTLTTLVKLAASAVATCAAVITTLYSNEEPTIGTIMYTDEALSVPLTGSAFGLFINQEIIYTINVGTGAIETVDSGTCTGNGFFYQYAPVMEDVYKAAAVQLYTPGSFGKGAIMYTDQVMSTKLTGQNFIAENNSAPMYTIGITSAEVGCIAVEC